MALVKCPDCGKMISSRAKQCPDCGCPAEYFIEEDIKKNESKVIFHIAGYDVGYEDSEIQRKVATYLGAFIKAADMAYDEMVEKYDSCKNIKEVLEKLAPQAVEVIDVVLDIVKGLIFTSGISMSIDEFLEKYYYKYHIDYREYYDKAVEIYAETMQLREKMAEYRQLEKDSRARWEGGGFGLKGAIKGAITASALNMGSDFVHSFGDSINEQKDNKRFNQILLELYNSQEMKSLLCDSLSDCIMNAYFAMKDELIEAGILNSDEFVLDMKKADVLFENTNTYLNKNNNDEWMKNIIECIRIYPGERLYYKVILGEIYDCLDSSDPNNFYAFLSYWGLDDMFIKNEDDENPKFEKLFIDRIEQELRKPGMSNIFNNMDFMIPFSDLSIEKQRLLKIKLQVIAPGNTLVYDDNSITVTDRYLRVNNMYSEAVALTRVLHIEYEYSKVNDKYSLYLYHIDGSVLQVTTDSDVGNNSIRLLVSILNIGLGYENASNELEQTFVDMAFEREYKKFLTNEKITKISHISEYTVCRLFYYNFMKKYKVGASSDCSSFLEFKELLNGDDVYNRNILMDVKFIEWIPSDCSLNDFINNIVFTRQLHDYLYFKWLWVLGDGENKYAPSADILRKYNTCGQIIMYKDFSDNGKKGFALTDKYLINLSDEKKIFLEDIQSITLGKNCIYFSDGTINSKISVYSMTGNNDCEWELDLYLSSIVNTLITFCIRFGNNKYLINADMINAQGIDEDDKLIKYKPFNQYIIDEGYGTFDSIDKDYFIEVAKKTIKYVKAFGCEDRVKTNLHMWTDHLAKDVVCSDELFYLIPDDTLVKDYVKIMAGTIDMLFSDAQFIFNDYCDIETYKKNVGSDGYICYWMTPKLIGINGFMLTNEYLFDFATRRKIYYRDIYNNKSHSNYLELHYGREQTYSFEMKDYDKCRTSDNVTSVTANFIMDIVRRTKKLMPEAINNMSPEEVGDQDLSVELLGDTIFDIYNEKGKIAAINYCRSALGTELKESERTVNRILKLHNIDVNSMEIKDIKVDNNDKEKLIDKQKKMFCPYCGKQILVQAKFCNYCGKNNNYNGGI